MEKVEYVTAADLRAWTYPSRESENRTHSEKSKPIDNPKPPRGLAYVLPGDPANL